MIATIPGEWQETALAAMDKPRWKVSHLDEESGKQKTKLISTHDLLFAGDVDETTRRRKSLSSNTLVLPGFNLYEALKIDEPNKLAWKEHLFDLRARHLEQTVLTGADLTKADLFGAQLPGRVAHFHEPSPRLAPWGAADLYLRSTCGTISLGCQDLCRAS